MIVPSLSSVPPGDFPARRWDHLRRDAADFLASPWAMEAARLGWTDLDLFGVDADRPYTRIDGPGPRAGARRLQDRGAQRRWRDPRNARRCAAELPPQAGSAGASAGVEGGFVTV